MAVAVTCVPAGRRQDHREEPNMTVAADQGRNTPMGPTTVGGFVGIVESHTAATGQIPSYWLG